MTLKIKEVGRVDDNCDVENREKRGIKKTRNRSEKEKLNKRIHTNNRSIKDNKRRMIGNIKKRKR